MYIKRSESRRSVLPAREAFRFEMQFFFPLITAAPHISDTVVRRLSPAPTAFRPNDAAC